MGSISFRGAEEEELAITPIELSLEESASSALRKKPSVLMQVKNFRMAQADEQLRRAAFLREKGEEENKKQRSYLSKRKQLNTTPAKRANLELTSCFEKSSLNVEWFRENVSADLPIIKKPAIMFSGSPFKKRPKLSTSQSRTLTKADPFSRIRLALEPQLGKYMNKLHPSDYEKDYVVTAASQCTKKALPNPSISDIKHSERKNFSFPKPQCTPIASYRKSTVKLDKVCRLPENILLTIFLFGIQDYNSFLCVNSAWNVAVTKAFDSLFAKVISKLANMQSNIVSIRNSYTAGAFSLANSRVDRILELELLPGCEMKSLVLSYTFSFLKEKHQRYRTSYKIDCAPKGKNTFWIHKTHSYRPNRVFTYSKNIIPVCAGDAFEIAINFFNFRGLVDLDSIKWMPPKIVEDSLYQSVSSLDKTRIKMYADAFEETQFDLNRICELEQIGIEWYDSEYYEIKGTCIDLKALTPFFEILSIESAAIDIIAHRIKLRAAKCGILSEALLGIKIIIKEKGLCVNEAKRIGLMEDRKRPLQLRKNDILYLYLSQNIA